MTDKKMIIRIVIYLLIGASVAVGVTIWKQNSHTTDNPEQELPACTSGTCPLRD